jgi:hypothetical protein
MADTPVILMDNRARLYPCYKGNAEWMLSKTIS